LVFMDWINQSLRYGNEILSANGFGLGSFGSLRQRRLCAPPTRKAFGKTLRLHQFYMVWLVFLVRAAPSPWWVLCQLCGVLLQPFLEIRNTGMFGNSTNPSAGNAVPGATKARS